MISSTPGRALRIFQPTLLNRPPQFVAEPEVFRPFGFLRLNPRRDLSDDHIIRLDLVIGVVSA